MSVSIKSTSARTNFPLTETSRAFITSDKVTPCFSLRSLSISVVNIKALVTESWSSTAVTLLAVVTAFSTPRAILPPTPSCGMLNADNFLSTPAVIVAFSVFCTSSLYNKNSSYACLVEYGSARFFSFCTIIDPYTAPILCISLLPVIEPYA